MILDLQELVDFDKLLKYLSDELKWPIDTEVVEEATFEYTPEELNINSNFAATIKSIKQLRPLADRQVWGIFFIEFHENRRGLPVMALRRILQALAISRRHDSSIPAWQRDDLLFICVYKSVTADKNGLTFAHFRDVPGGQPELRTFSWDSRETHFYYLRNLNLNALHWPENDRDADAWREQWRRAFTVRHRYTIRTAEKLAGQMARQAVMIRELVTDLYEAEDENGALHRLLVELGQLYKSGLQDQTLEARRDFADMIAQTITYGVFSAAVQHRKVSLINLADSIPDTNLFLKRMLQTLTTEGNLDLDELGVGQLLDLLSQVELETITQDFGRQTGSGREDPVVHFYEQFLNEYDREKRVQRGVFYTPDPVVDYIVRAVDQILQRKPEEGGFGIEDGLASDATTDNGEPLVQILDPATGTGTFLAHIIEHITERKNKRRRSTPEWNQYVANSLLKRLNGFELMMAPYTIAHLKLALKLSQTGYTFGAGERLRVFLTNALEKPDDPVTRKAREVHEPLAHEASEAADVKDTKPVIVVIGNPPYAVNSANEDAWTTDAIRQDYYPNDAIRENNPKSLLDDYVQFIRFAQERIHTTGEGIVAFITNHGYLENPTFRRMRFQLMQEFDEIYVLDLHGNPSKSKTAPDGSKDENVFDITIGVSIGIFVKHRNKVKPSIYYKELWGSRDSKYRYLSEVNLSNDTDWIELQPKEPFYLFAPQSGEIHAEFVTGWRITNIFPIHGTGLKSRRDTFLIDFDYQTLRAKFEDIASNPNVHELKKKYQITDSTDWTLARAKSYISVTPVIDHIENITFRPFDNRFIYYRNEIIERGDARWPIMRHLIHNKNNIGMITTRQVTSLNFEHVFCSRHLVEMKTGSHDRGCDFSPLYEYPETDESFDIPEQWPRTNGRRPNLSKAFVAEVAGKIGMRFVTDGRGDLHQTFGPEDIFHYAYAIFHCPTYRERYAEQLKIDFPRLPLTGDVELFRQLVALGVDLVALHLLENDYEGTSWQRNKQSSPLSQPITRFVQRKSGMTVGGMSKSRVYDEQLKRIYLDTANLKDASYFEFIEDISPEEAEETWDFQIGGYQVLHKWLYDRRPQGTEPGRTLTDEDLQHYQRVVVALYTTRKLMRDIDEVIEAHGGFPLRGSTPDEQPVQVEEEKDIEMSNKNSDWQESQPKLVYVEGDQLPLGYQEEDEDEFVPQDPGSIELSPVPTLTAEDAMTQMEGLEVEREDEAEPFVKINKPFDPNKIRMTSQQMSLDILINRMDDKRISIPRYQRSEGIWNDVKKSRLIESILIKIPLPAFYMDATDDDNWRIIDGLQRLTTLRQFVLDRSLRLTGLEFLELPAKGEPDLGAGYDDLPRNLQRRIAETQVTVYFVQEGTPPEVTYNIFKRINTGGEALSAQEIRNAINDGPAVTFLETLAKSPEFLQATGHSIKPLRKADQEVVLRFIAFITQGRPTSNDIDQFMNKTMEYLNRTDTDRAALEKRFIRTMRAANSILAEYAFRKIMPSGRRGQVSRALFDAWSVNFDELNDQQIARLSQKRPSSRLLARFKMMLKDDVDFNRAITASTGDPARIEYRYEAIKRIIYDTLGV